MSVTPVITIDGPGGSGKGTLAAATAAALGFHLLDSGALYRLTALAAGRAGLDTDDTAALAVLARDLDIRFAGAGGGTQVWLQGEEVSDAIRSEDCARDASRVARHQAVRDALLASQRGFRRAPGLVADGRDMGTVVFPAATLKIFLTASPQARAQRRYKQLIDKGFDVNLRALLEDIQARDDQDTRRAVAPLQAAPDAVVIDSTSLSIAEVEQRVLALARARLADE